MGVSLTELYNAGNRLLLYNDSHALAILSETDRKAIIEDAVKEYSVLRPRIILQAYTGTTDNWYDLPDSWEDGFSYINEIEYPIENSPKSVITEKDYFISLMSDGQKIRFQRNNPSLNNTFWVKYAIRFTFDSNYNSEIPQADKGALSYLVVSLWCDAFATYFASKADPSLSGVEVITQTSRVDEYTQKAKDWYKKYKDAIESDITGFYGKVGFLQNPYWDRDNE